MATVEDAFRWARIHAMRHMAVCEDARLHWGETSVTELVIAHAATAVTVVPFTQQAERVSGADWIWWWVDRRGAYGMLVQAKRVDVRGSRWKFNFGYPNRTDRQRSTLISTASSLGLLPVYALYLGTGTYRGWAPCPDSHRSGRCLSCIKRSVSLMPALLADSSVDAAAITYERSVALEELGAASTSGLGHLSGPTRQYPKDLKKFLEAKQDGTYAVTRAMIDRVLRVRTQQFLARPTTVPVSVGSSDRNWLGSVFAELPDDDGHFGQNYFRHVLDPLRHSLPSYALNAPYGEVDFGAPAFDMPENVAGIVIIHLETD